MTKLTNSQGKKLYTDPENIRKAMHIRKDRLYGKGLLKYNQTISLFKIENRRVVTQ